MGRNIYRLLSLGYAIHYKLLKQILPTRLQQQSDIKNVI